METSFSKRTSLLATIPFGIFGITWAVSNSGLGISNFIQGSLLLVSVLAMFVLLGVGWSKNFPRWSFPAIGFCLLFTAFFVTVAIPAIKREPLGYWAVLPLVITLVICLFFNPKLKPIKHLIQKTKEDLSLILFALYGFAPAFFFICYDEMHSIWLIPVILLSTVILSFGLYSFLRSDRKKIRIMSIIVSGVVVLIITLVTWYFYW